MKTLSFVVAAALLGLGSHAYSQVQRDNSNRPCVEVNVQIDKNNKADVKQDCGKNISRTYQAGQNNEAMTQQTGDVNDNRVIQKGFNAQQRRPAQHGN